MNFFKLELHPNQVLTLHLALQHLHLTVRQLLMVVLRLLMVLLMVLHHPMVLHLHNNNSSSGHLNHKAMLLKLMDMLNNPKANCYQQMMYKEILIPFVPQWKDLEQMKKF